MIAFAPDPLRPAAVLVGEAMPPLAVLLASGTNSFTSWIDLI
jgi:uncharacterized membrane protein YqaE (UPF0057 family)